MEIDYLETIRQRHQKPTHPYVSPEIGLSQRPFEKRLIAESLLAVIAEIKRRSPSKGRLGFVGDPKKRAEAYASGGAAAISVLTEEEGFGGSIDDLRKVVPVGLPVLRKDFLLDPHQLPISRSAGAACVLLIVALLGKRTQEMIEAAEGEGLESLVEVQNEQELEIAVDAGARIIGVNNRNLTTFYVDTAVAQRLHRYLPESVVTVAASGIHTADDAKRMRDCGFDAILVGEALMRASDSTRLIEELRA